MPHAHAQPLLVAADVGAEFGQRGLRFLAGALQARGQFLLVGDLLLDAGQRGARAHPRSGGERQMLAMGRALMMNPQVLLLDEPLSGLDQETHDALINDLARVLKQTATTALLVTHNHSEADFLADTTFVFPHK